MLNETAGESIFQLISVKKITLGVCSVVNNTGSALNDGAGTVNFPSYALVMHLDMNMSLCWVRSHDIKNMYQKYTFRM